LVSPFSVGFTAPEEGEGDAMVVGALQVSEEDALDYIHLNLKKISHDVVGLGTSTSKLGSLATGSMIGSLGAVSPGRRRRHFMGDGEKKRKGGRE
jgi:hypothetical protein